MKFSKHMISKQTNTLALSIYDQYVLIKRKGMDNCIIYKVSNRLNREIKIMQLLRDGPNILPLLDILQDTETGYPMIVTKWVDSIHYRVLSSFFPY